MRTPGGGKSHFLHISADVVAAYSWAGTSKCLGRGVSFARQTRYNDGEGLAKLKVRAGVYPSDNPRIALAPWFGPRVSDSRGRNTRKHLIRLDRIDI
jgi:hypothetical protein